MVTFWNEVSVTSQKDLQQTKLGDHIDRLTLTVSLYLAVADVTQDA
jgi:hypothetical protein